MIQQINGIRMLALTVSQEIMVGTWVNTKTCLTTEISKDDQCKERNLFCKSVLRFFNRSALTRSLSFCMWTARR